MHTKQELDERMRLAGIRPLKSLGQNFLLNPRITDGLIQAVAKTQAKTVVEIGPGLGALTDDLIKGPWETILIELDGGLAEYWKERAPEIKLINKDALQQNWSELNLVQPAILTSNLPYSIAASMVVELSSIDFKPFAALILMFQKEVAQRIAAKPNDEDYGMLSVIAQVQWTIEKVIDAGPQDFFPVPNVGSRVLLMTSRETQVPPVDFLSFVKLAFSQRRKKLASNLQGLHDKQRVADFLSQMGFDANTRAQELSPLQFVELFSLLNGKKR